MKLTSRPKTITSVGFAQRARHYQLAAAMTDAPREVEMFLDLAIMFERLSEELARAEARLHLVRA
jgi:hypothetical protein